VWAYFNNDRDGYAMKYARELLRHLRSDKLLTRAGKVLPQRVQLRRLDVHTVVMRYRFAPRPRMMSALSLSHAFRSGFPCHFVPVTCSFSASPLPTASHSRPGHIAVRVPA